MEERRQPGPGVRMGRLLSRLLVTGLVLGLGAAVAVLLSQLNAHTFTLEVNGRQLEVRKGLLLPVGSEPYRPAEPHLAEAYAPLPLEPGANVTTLVGRSFRERGDLDQALFPVLLEQARSRLQSDEPEAVERGLYYLHRAELLTGLSEAQRKQLQELQGQAALRRAMRSLSEAGQKLSEALDQLRLAAQTGATQSVEARRLLGLLEPGLRALESLLGFQKHSRAMAPAAPTTPTPERQATPEEATGGSAAPPAPEAGQGGQAPSPPSASSPQ